MAQALREYETVKDQIYAQTGTGHVFPPVMAYTGPPIDGDGRPTLELCTDLEAEWDLPFETVCASAQRPAAPAAPSSAHLSLLQAGRCPQQRDVLRRACLGGFGHSDPFLLLAR
jgi:hypothetical protein